MESSQDWSLRPLYTKPLPPRAAMMRRSPALAAPPRRDPAQSAAILVREAGLL